MRAERAAALDRPARRPYATTMKRKAGIFRHLDDEYTEPIRDPIWKHIHLSRGLMELTASPPFRKLSGIKQLGITHLVYPGATHTRFSHSLGVFHLSKRMIRGLLKYDETDFLTLEGVKAFLCAALLHDIGHFPFTHSLKELPLRTHESLTAEIVSGEPVADVISKKVGADPRTVAAIVDPARDAGKDREIVFFRGLLSGVLDPDKLDYLNRDAYFCGVPYGIQDTDFALERILPHPERGLSLEAAGVPAVENVLFSKYLMYRAVYWHKTVRIATAMIKKALVLALKDGELVPEDLYGLDDEDFFRTVGGKDYPPFALVKKVAARDLFRTVAEIPFDDRDPRHARLGDLLERAKLEKELASRFSLPREDVLVDIPEKITFEIDLPIRLPEGGLREYAESGSVFSPPVVEGFTRTLRVLRLALPREERPERARAVLEDSL